MWKNWGPQEWAAVAGIVALVVAAVKWLYERWKAARERSAALAALSAIQVETERGTITGLELYGWYGHLLLDWEHFGDVWTSEAIGIARDKLGDPKSAAGQGPLRAALLVSASNRMKSAMDLHRLVSPSGLTNRGKDALIEAKRRTNGRKTKLGA